MLAFLSGNALFTDCCSLDGVADASHTFDASFTSGDTSLLTTVPEPAVGGLLLAAIGLTVGVARFSARSQSYQKKTASKIR